MEHVHSHRLLLLYQHILKIKGKLVNDGELVLAAGGRFVRRSKPGSFRFRIRWKQSRGGLFRSRSLFRSSFLASRDNGLPVGPSSYLVLSCRVVYWSFFWHTLGFLCLRIFCIRLLFDKNTTSAFMFPPGSSNFLRRNPEMHRPKKLRHPPSTIFMR